MPRNAIPKYRKQTRPGGKDVAFVEIHGQRRYLGRYASPESREAYARLIAEMAVSTGELPVSPNEITVAELVAAFWRFAESYYVKPNGDTTCELEMFRTATRPVVALYGSATATSFGPRSLKAVRQEMVKADLCRSYINKQISRIKRIWKWGAAEELVPASVFHTLQTVAGLKRGRTEARESEPVLPAPEELVEATLPHLTPTLRAMVELQRATGMRPGEVVLIRTVDLDMSGETWTYRPQFHKTQHHGRNREIFIGPRGQDILRPFLRSDLHEHVFSPIRSEDERRRMMHETRVTPLSCGHKPGNNRKRHPKWGPNERYRTDTYGKAIAYACKRAFPAPDGVKCEALKAWRKDHAWAPNQLRHSFATKIRKDYGLESAQVLLGHSHAAITEVYAERDTARAIDVISRVG